MIQFRASSSILPWVLFFFVERAGAVDPPSITFPAADGLQVTADLYIAHPTSSPFIVLFHQAYSSRGEYLEIAPKLNALGFNAIAVDQRSGLEINGVVNETAQRAAEQGLSQTYLDALPDIFAAIAYSKQHYVQGKLIIWGSSYSSSLALKIAGDDPSLVDGVLAFSPAEYFGWLGVGNDYILSSADTIVDPAFITSARSELYYWLLIFQTIPSRSKRSFLPDVEGRHGSSALWESTPGHEAAWAATNAFLRQFLPGESDCGVNCLPARGGWRAILD